MSSAKQRRRTRSKLPDGVVGTQAALARAVGVSPKTIEHWRQLEMPAREDGTYSIADVVRWKVAREQQVLQAKQQRRAESDLEGDEVPINLVDRNLYFDAKLKSEKLKAMRQKAMPLPHVQQLLRERAAALRKEMLALARRLAPRCEGRRQAEIRTILDEAFARLLEGYATSAGGEK